MIWSCTRPYNDKHLEKMLSETQDHARRVRLEGVVKEVYAIVLLFCRSI